MNIDDKYADLISKALYWYLDQIEDELEEVNGDPSIKEYMGGLMTREEYIHDSESAIKTINELLPTIDAVANNSVKWGNINTQLIRHNLEQIINSDAESSISSVLKEKLKSKIDNMN